MGFLALSLFQIGFSICLACSNPCCREFSVGVYSVVFYANHLVCEQNCDFLNMLYSPFGSTVWVGSDCSCTPLYGFGLVDCFACTWMVDGLNLVWMESYGLVYLWCFLWWLPGVGFVFLWFTTSPPPPGFLTDLEISKLDWIAVNLSASNLRLTYWGKTPFMLTLTAIQSWPPYPPLLVGGVVGWLWAW